ncbi:MAG: TetR/AcrR family transcriptional regulator [Actinobacteria bacterium]|jgi:AcrR family transcriptional regulator|nr:MAG: TetR/AcrR family transcriptional regulator [Actinomycetota bacterium]
MARKYGTRGNRRQQIIEAAMKAFAAKNYDGASVSDIADAAGITKRAIYRYFSTKRELFYAVRNEVYAAIVNNLWSDLPPAKDFNELADALMRNHLRFMLENPEMARIVVNTISEAATREFQENIEALLDERAEEIEGLMQSGIEEGTLDPELDPTFVSWVLVQIFIFLVYMQAYEEDWLIPRGEEAASVLMKPFLASLAPRA